MLCCRDFIKLAEPDDSFSKGATVTELKQQIPLLIKSGK